MAPSSHRKRHGRWRMSPSRFSMLSYEHSSRLHPVPQPEEATLVVQQVEVDLAVHVAQKQA